MKNVCARETAPKVAVIGGGNATSRLANGLADHGFEVTAIVTTMDNGGSTGRLRRDYPGHIGVGDIRQVMQTLATNRELAEEEFIPRDEDNHARGNKRLVETALEAGGVHMIEHAIDYWSGRLALKGSVIPVTLDSADLRLDFSSGSFEPIIGESEIAYSKDPIRDRLGKLSLTPQPSANPRAIESIYDADVTVLGPGGIYNSATAPLLVPGVAESIQSSRAPFVMFCNLINDPKTQGFSVADYVNELEYQTGTRPDAVVAHHDKTSVAAASQELVALTQPGPTRLITASVASHEIPQYSYGVDELASVRSSVVHCGRRAAAVLLNHMQAA